MDRLLPYLLIVILLVGGWNETFKSRFERLTGKSEEQPAEQAVVETPTATPTPKATATPLLTAPHLTPKPTPRSTPVPTSTPVVQQSGGAFFNNPNYRSSLDNGTSSKKH